MKPLSEIKLEMISEIGEKKAAVLKQELGLLTLKDLFDYYPYRYVDKSHFIKIAEINSSDVYTLLIGKVVGKGPRARGAR